MLDKNPRSVLKNPMLRALCPLAPNIKKAVFVLFRHSAAFVSKTVNSMDEHFRTLSSAKFASEKPLPDLNAVSAFARAAGKVGPFVILAIFIF